MANNNDNKKKAADPRGEVRTGWHFLPADMKLGYGDGRVAKVGETLSMTAGRPRLCHDGMHASPTPANAARHTKGPVLTKVEVWGDVSGDNNKFTGRNRKVLWAKEIPLADFHKFAKEIKKAGGDCCSYLGKTSDVDAAVQNLGSIYGETNYKIVDRVILKWAKDNGCPNVRIPSIPKKPEPKKPKITAYAIRQYLDSHQVTSENEVKRDLKSAGYDMNTYNDAVYNANVIRVRSWKPGYGSKSPVDGLLLHHTR